MFSGCNSFPLLLATPSKYYKYSGSQGQEKTDFVSILRSMELLNSTLIEGYNLCEK